MIIYRVILEVGYNKTYFEFNTAEEAAGFAKIALEHMVGCDDTKKKCRILMAIVDVEAEKKEKEDE